MNEAGSPDIAFLWCDASRLERNVKRVEKEVRSTFSEMEVEVEWWENEEDFSASSAPIQLRVVMLQSEPHGPGWNLSPNVMGTVVRAGNETIESLYIFYPNLMRHLGLNPGSGRTLAPGVRRDLARALGRVIAHEAIHAVVPSLSHAEEGLLDDQLNSSFMKKRRAKLDPSSQAQLLLGLAERREQMAKADPGSLEEAPVQQVAAATTK